MKQPALLSRKAGNGYLHVFDRHLQNQPFLLGSRPGAGDYGCFGQMTMLVLTDPTPQAVSRRISLVLLHGQKPWKTILDWRSMTLIGLT